VRLHQAAVSLDAAAEDSARWEPAAPDCPDTIVLNRESGGRHASQPPPPQRAAVWLRVALEYTDEEVAQILRVPVGTVKSWVWRSLARIRRAWAQSDLQVGEGL